METPESPDPVRSEGDGPLGFAPTEDQGAVASDGFGFQHDVIAKLVIEMLRGEAVTRVVCETYEDALVFFADDSAELVSVKAIAPSDRYTPTSLLTDGGLLHLFENWRKAPNGCRARLITDGQLSPGKEGAKGLVEVCEKRNETQIEIWAARLATGIDSVDVDEFAGFLACLAVEWQSSIGARVHLPVLNQHKLKPWLREASISELYATQCYRLLRDQVAECCRATAADPMRGLDLFRASTAPAESAEAVRLANRTIDRERAISVMLQPARAGGELSGDPASLDHSRMAVKLERGVVPPQVISAARRLRASWYGREATLSDRAPGGVSGFEDLRARVLLIAGDVAAGLDLTEPYGQRMYNGVRSALRVDALPQPTMPGLSDELLLGLAFQLTDECELFWSEEFDVEETLK